MAVHKHGSSHGDNSLVGALVHGAKDLLMGKKAGHHGSSKKDLKQGFKKVPKRKPKGK